MNQLFEIPLNPAPQILTTSLGGVEYQLTLQYRNCAMGGWILDIADGNGIPILSGIPLVTGADLLAQYGYLDFGGMLWSQTTTEPDAPPTFTNLGTDSKLYWVTP